jgi:hypothetical protein
VGTPPIRYLSQHIGESAKKKRKRRVKLFCTICQKFNHNTKDCTGRIHPPINQKIYW